MRTFLVEFWKLIKIYILFFFKRKPRTVSNNKTVVFNTVSLLGHHAAVELELAREYSMRGWTSYLLIDDGVYPMTDKFQYKKGIDLENLNIFRRAKKLKLLKLKVQLQQWYLTYYHPNIKIIWMSSIKNKLNTNNDLTSLDKHIRSSLIRFFQDEHPEEFEFYDDYKAKVIETAKFSRSLGEYVKKNLKPDTFITGHGIYVTWGPILDYLKREEVQTYVYSMPGYISGTIRVIDVIAQSMMNAKSWLSFYKKDLDDREIRKSREIFEKRFRKEAVDTQDYSFDTVNIDRIGDFVNKFDYCIGLFPNVIWDGNVEERNSIFKGITEWIVKTIKELEGTNIGLIIRFHPAEFRRLKARPLEEIIRKEIPNIYDIENLLIISSEETIDTYHLIRNHIDIGITYDGNLSLEIPYLGTPLISAGKGRLSQPYWSFMPEDFKQYSKWILNPTLLIEEYKESRKEIKTAILKFNYWMNEFSAIPVRTLKNSQKQREIENPLDVLSILNNSNYSVLEKLSEKGLIEQIESK